MIGYFFLAVGLLFAAYCFGLGAGQGIGYKKAHEENQRVFEFILQSVSDINKDALTDMVNKGLFDRVYLVPKNEVNTDETVQTPEGSDREAP